MKLASVLPRIPEFKPLVCVIAVDFSAVVLFSGNRLEKDICFFHNICYTDNKEQGTRNKELLADTEAGNGRDRTDII